MSRFPSPIREHRIYPGSEESAEFKAISASASTGGNIWAQVPGSAVDCFYTCTVGESNNNKKKVGQFQALKMGHKVVVFDISGVRTLWETRVKKHKAWQKKEEERLEKSALEKIKEEWNFVAECRRKGIVPAVHSRNGLTDTNARLLERMERNALTRPSSLSKEKGKGRFVFELSGQQWTELPESLKEQTHLREWYITDTLIQSIPSYIELFEAMRILDLPQNQLTHLPAEIGCLKNLRELNVSFNHLKDIPPELGDCENLEKLDCSGNLELTELPFELSNLKQVTFIDISANKFPSVPVCVLRMTNLQWLDISNNNLNDLPQDIDRLQELQTFLLYKNKLTYLPAALLNLKKLTLLVVSGDHLVELPTTLCDSSTPLKFVSLMDNPIDNTQCENDDKTMESEQDRQHFDKEFMKAYIEDVKERESVPSYTTKSIDSQERLQEDLQGRAIDALGLRYSGVCLQPLWRKRRHDLPWETLPPHGKLASTWETGLHKGPVCPQSLVLGLSSALQRADMMPSGLSSSSGGSYLNSTDEGYPERPPDFRRLLPMAETLFHICKEWIHDRTLHSYIT